MNIKQNKSKFSFERLNFIEFCALCFIIFIVFVRFLYIFSYDIDFEGVEFALVALFTIIFIEQWKNNVDHKPAILGFIIAAVVVIFNQGSNMITISIAILLLISILTKKRTNHYS